MNEKDKKMSFKDYLKKWDIEWLSPDHKFTKVVHYNNHKKIPFKKGITDVNS
jgi:hypothetical protein